MSRLTRRDEIYRSYRRIRHVKHCARFSHMFIPIITSHCVALRRLSPGSYRNLDQSSRRYVQTSSRSNPSCQTDGWTYEISSPGCSSIPIVFHIYLSSFSPGAGTKARSGQHPPGRMAGEKKTGSLRLVARIHNLSSRGLPARKPGPI